MLNANFFRTVLNSDVAHAGGKAIVEVVLLSGLRHRVRAVLETEDGYVTLETYSPRASEPMARAGDDELLFGATAEAETERVSVSYDAIAEVLVNAVRKKDVGKIGFHA